MIQDAVASRIRNDVVMGSGEKTFTDKLLAKEEQKALAEILKKSRLSNDDVSQIESILVGTNSKLVNLGQEERYKLGLYWTWVQEVITLHKLMNDYNDNKGMVEKSAEIQKIYNDSILISTHLVREFVNLFLYIIHTGLSLNGYLVDGIMTSRYEVGYADNTKPLEPAKKGFWS